MTQFSKILDGYIKDCPRNKSFTEPAFSLERVNVAVAVSTWFTLMTYYQVHSVRSVQHYPPAFV